MRAIFRVTQDQVTRRRQLRMVLSGDEWGTFSIPYANLEGAGVVAAFKVPPASGEGLLPGRDYELADGLTAAQLLSMLDKLHGVIAIVKPIPAAAPVLSIEDEREY